MPVSLFAVWLNNVERDSIHLAKQLDRHQKNPEPLTTTAIDYMIYWYIFSELSPDQELADAAAYAPGRRHVYTHEVTLALFCMK